MSSYVEGSGPAGQRKDPVVRFLLGCAAVACVLVVIVVFVAFVVGWRLTRDETAGRSLETFPIGDETRYWNLDLKANDPGLVALFDRFEEINDSARRGALKGTLFETLPLPHRRARLDQLAPLAFEIAVVMSDTASESPRPTAWAARGTLSHGMLRLRAGLKLMRWITSREPGKTSATTDDGVEVTEIHDNNVRFAVATVGNRVLLASDATRLGSILHTAAHTPAASRSELLALHAAVRLDGEDAWAYIADTRLGGAAASFDVNDRDELAFRAAISEPGGTRGDCAELLSAFLPGIPAAAIDLDAAASARTCTGRVPGLSKVLAALVTSVTERRLLTGLHPSPEPETPFASPPRPSPAPP